MGFMTNSLYFGILITILGYFIGDYLRKKLNLSILNPILIGIIFVGVIITLCKVEYKTYYEGAKYISFLLTPATICLSLIHILRYLLP